MEVPANGVGAGVEALWAGLTPPITGHRQGHIQPAPPARRPRRIYLHHWHSTNRADDLSISSSLPFRTKVVPETLPWLVRRLFRYSLMKRVERPLRTASRASNVRTCKGCDTSGPRMERETSGQRPRPNDRHPHPSRSDQPLRPVQLATQVVTLCCGRERNNGGQHWIFANIRSFECQTNQF